MATTAQIQITVDESGVVTGVNKIGESVSALDLKMQEMGKRADAIWGNLANAPKEVQQQFAFLNSEAAKLQSNTLAVSQEMARLAVNMNDAAGASTMLAASQGDVSAATMRATGSYQMASSGLSLLEGRANSANRAAAQFLTTTLGLGGALNGAFQVFGAAALVEVLVSMGKAAYDLYQDVVNLKKANEDLDKIDLKVAADSKQMEDAIERQRVKFVELTQGVIAARQEEERFFANKPVDLSAFFNEADFRKLSDNVKQDTQKLFQSFDPSQFTEKIQLAKDKIADLQKQIANPVIETGAATGQTLVLTNIPLLQAQERLYEDILKELTDKQKLFSVTAMTNAGEVGKAMEDAANKSQAVWDKALTAGEKALQKYTKELIDEPTKEGQKLSQQQNDLFNHFANKDFERNQKMVSDFDKAQSQKLKIEADTVQKYDLLEDAAASASENRWLSATARIELQAQKQADAWQKEADQTQVGQQIAAQGTADIWTAAAARIEQEQQQLGTKLGNEFEQFFNDLTSGNIGKTILQGFERFFFNILGQWAATVKGMQNVTTNGSGNLVQGLLQSAFSFLSPPPVTGAQAQAQAATTLGGPNAAATLYGLGGTGAGINSSLNVLSGTPLAGFGDILGLGSLSTAATGSSAPSAAMPSSPSVGGASAVKQGLTGALSISGLQKLAPLALLMAAASGKVGGKAGSLGLGLAGLGAMFELNPSMFGGALSFFNISNPLMASGFGALTGGLAGFGLGSQFGPAIGALGGAAAGAGSVALAALLAGTAAFPVVGTIIGGIVGALAGLFGGLFGGGPSKHTLADRYINANILPAIKQEVTNYEGFQTDYSTAINDLDQMKQQSLDTLHQQFGKDAATDEWNKYVSPAITQAETQIKNDEAERNRRSSLMFGPPQFADGGQFFAATGSGPAILHDGEVVMTQAAVRTFGPSTLLGMNEIARSGRAGAPIGAGTVVHNHYYINAVDARSFESYLKRGGADVIHRVFKNRALEGR